MSTSVAPDSRFTRRRWQRRWTSWRRWLLLVVIVAVGGGTAWMFLVSSQLAADEVDVSGAHALSEREVLAAAEIASGTPLLRVDLDAIHDRVAALPEVAAVTVHRSWPDTVSISVTEREPLAVVEAGAAWWAMDEDGVLFRRTPSRSKLPRRLPLVVVDARGDADARSEVAAVVAALPSELLAKVERVTAQSMDSITLQFSGRTEVMWGSSADSDTKAEVLGILLLLLTHGQPALLDVSVPQHPTSASLD